ncbi:MULTISPECIES: hypothetical protein [Okeania]|nr:MULTISPECIES: hypothetical protein [Okeania]
MLNKVFLLRQETGEMGMSEEVGAKFCQSDFSAFASVKVLTFLT